MKLKNYKVFLIISSVWFIDFLTTVIALNIGLYESNPIARFLYSFGFFGFVFSFVLVMISLFVYSIFLNKISYNKYNSLPRFTTFLGVSIFVVLEIYTIINNVFLIAK